MRGGLLGVLWGRTRRALAPAFSPSNIPDLAWWLDAADAATIQQVGGSVSQWNDKSPTPYNVTQATGAAQPVTGVNTVNGKNVITFDGIDDGLLSPTFFQVAQGPNVTFVVNRASSIIGNRYLVAAVEGTTQWWSVRTTATNALFTNGGAASTAVSPVNTPNIVVGERNGMALDVGVNGSPLTSTTLGQNRPTSNGVRVGYEDFGGGRNYFAGDLGEILVYARALSADEINSVGQYLAAKWGVTWTNV